MWEASDKGCAPLTYTRTHYQLSKLQNDLLVSRKALPEKTKLEEELTTAQVEVRVHGRMRRCRGQWGGGQCSR